MSTARARARGGNAPLRTATQLGDLLTIPLYWMLTGKARAAYPFSTRASPSSFVRIQGVGGDDELPATVDVHWEQWQNVVVPVLSDDRVLSWLGGFHTGNNTILGWLTTGADVTLPVSVTAPDGTTAVTTGGTTLSKGTVVGKSVPQDEHLNPLYAQDHVGFQVFLKAFVIQQAKAAGY